MNADGFYLCHHCHRVVVPSATEIEAAENGPDGRLTGLQCPVCRRREVDWIQPGPAQKPKAAPGPVDPERAAEWFAKMRDAVNSGTDVL